MRARRWWPAALAAVLVGGLVGVGAGVLAASGRRSTQLPTSAAEQFVAGGGRTAPAWTLPALRLGAGRVSLAQFRGRLLVLNFWASWCVPCRQEMPALQQAFVAQHGRIAFVGVDTNDTRTAALRFVRATGVTYPLAFDPSARVGADLYGVFGLPTTEFVSARGRLLGWEAGGLTPQSLSALLARLLR